MVGVPAGGSSGAPQPDCKLTASANLPCSSSPHPAGGDRYEALLAGSYEQYVRNQQAGPEWEGAPEQMEQVCCCLLVARTPGEPGDT